MTTRTFDRSNEQQAPVKRPPATRLAGQPAMPVMRRMVHGAVRPAGIQWHRYRSDVKDGGFPEKHGLRD